MKQKRTRKGSISTPAGRRRLLVTALAALGLVAVAPLPASATFSGPNGRIAFMRATPDNGDFSIFAANPDGSAEVRLTTEPSGSNDWSPNGARIAFSFLRSEDPFEVAIATMNPDGTGVVPLTTGPGLHDQPTWSPDGEQIAYSFGDDVTHAIQIMDAATGDNVVRVTSNPYGFDDRQPSWSPDGRWIAFIRVRHSRTREATALFLVRPDGTELQRLTAWGINAEYPDWSPDGSLIVLSSKATVAAPSRIITIDPDGSSLTDLVKSTASADFHDPTWSPDGTKLIFQGWLVGPTPIPPNPPRVRSLWTVNADGSGLQRIEGIAGDELYNPDWGSYPFDTLTP